MGARLPEVSGTYITMHQPTGFAETAERVSKIIKEDKKDILLEYLRLIEPGVEDIAVFQDNANSQTYVKNESGFVPVSLMGGGFRALHDIATAAMLSKNGVVFLDEMDASLHYTVVASVWKAIAEISKSEKVQIFSVTHSKETLNSIVEGVEQAGAQDGFRYVRMNKNGKEHKTTVYKFSDLKDAIELNVEVRK
jgi:AAA15 family ATPase/GTPase